jgi:hypothetical protein
MLLYLYYWNLRQIKNIYMHNKRFISIKNGEFYVDLRNKLTFLKKAPR